MPGTMAPKIGVLPLAGTELNEASVWVRWCSFPVVAACMVACLVYLWVPASMADPDIWWHLRDAEYLVKTHRFLTQDLFSFTAAGAPWIDHEWMSELPFYLGWRLGGARGVYLVTLGTVEAILLGVFYLSYRKSRSTLVAIVGSVVATVLATLSFGPRTLLFGWLCLMAELLVLDWAAEDERWLWALPPLFGLWVNLHGSWVIGLVLLTVYGVCAHLPEWHEAFESRRWSAEGLRSLRLAWCGSVVALFANPYGWRLVLYPADLAFRQKLNIENVEEWKTLDFHSPRGKIFLAMVAVLFVVQVLRGRRWVPHELVFAAIGIYAACTYSRFTFLAAMLVVPILAGQLSGDGEAAVAGGDRPWLNLSMVVAMVFFVAQRAASVSGMGKEAESYPVQATGFLQGFRPEGRVFNDYLWGGYLEWNVRQIPVFIDSRVDIFERNGSFRDYLDVARIRTPLELLDKYKIRYVLYREGTPLSYLLAHSAGWKTDYQDGTTVLFERLGP